MANPKYEFNEYIEFCKEYIKEFESIKIPYNYVTKEGVKLGSWVCYCRRHMDRLSEDKKRALNEIGFEWYTDKSWMCIYGKVKEYYDKYGSLKDVNVNTVYEGTKIGIWLRNQRIKNEEGNLAPNRKKLLSDLGVAWRSKSATTYSKQLSLLKSYYKKKGHLLPPVSEVYRKEKIGVIVARLRSMYKKGRLSEDKIKELESIGMCWSGRYGFWKYNYDLCKKCINEGNYLTAQTEYEGIKIGEWLFRQRTLIDNGSLNEEQINMVNELFDSRPKRSIWYENFNIVKEYYSQNKDFKNAGKYKGLDINKWIYQQEYLHKDGRLKDEYVEALKDFGLLADKEVIK